MSGEVNSAGRVGLKVKGKERSEKNTAKLVEVIKKGVVQCLVWGDG